MAHICISKLTIIVSDNGLLPGQHQAIIWSNAGILLIEPLGTNFDEILIEIYTFSSTKTHLKMSSEKWWPFCLGLNVLNICHTWLFDNANLHWEKCIWFSSIWKSFDGQMDPYIPAACFYWCTLHTTVCLIWCLKSSVNWQFVQQLVQANNKANTNAPRYWPLVRGIYRWLVDDPHQVPVMQEVTLYHDIILTHWGRDKMADIYVFSWIKTWPWPCEFRLIFHWSLCIRVQLTIFHISSDNGLAPSRWQAIIWTNDGELTDTYMSHSASVS